MPPVTVGSWPLKPWFQIHEEDRSDPGGGGCIGERATRHSMGKGRVELPRLAAHDPKSCLSASSSTSPSTTERERANQPFAPDLLAEFLQSRRDGTSEHTLKFYHTCLKRFLGHELTARSTSEFLHNLKCRNAKHSYCRAIRALCGWLCKEGHLEDNPMGRVDAPKVAKRLLPTVTLEQLDVLLNAADNLRVIQPGSLALPPPYLGPPIDTLYCPGLF
jgi:hypothetical protein